MYTLLPNQAGGPPPIHVKLTAEILEQITNANGKGITVSLTGNAPCLKIDSHIFPAHTSQEPSYHALYQRKGDSLQSLGQIAQKMVLKRSSESPKRPTNSASASASPRMRVTPSPSPQPKSHPSSPAVKAKNRTLNIPVSKPLSRESSSSLAMRVLHLLALQPTTAEAVANRTKNALADVSALCKEYGVQVSAGYKLADRYFKDLRIWDWKPYSDEERDKVVVASQEAFDRLKLASDHPARRNLIDPKIRREREREQKEKEREEREREREKEREKEKEKSDRDSRTSRESSSSSSTPPAEAPGKRVGGLLVTKQPLKKRKAETEPVKKTVKKPAPTTKSSPGPASKASPALGPKASPALGSKAPPASGSSKSSPAPSSNASRPTVVTNAKASPAPALASSSSTSNSTSSATTPAPHYLSLARQFKESYDEYVKMYKTVAKQPGSDMKKLLVMHRQLETWKKELWAYDKGRAAEVRQRSPAVKSDRKAVSTKDRLFGMKKVTT